MNKEKIMFFETIKCEDEEVLNLSYHQKRMANTVGINFDLGEYIYPPSTKLLKCKLIYNKDGITNISFSEYKKREICSFKLIYDDEIKYNKKAINRENIDNLFLQKDEADEIIIIKNGVVTDTSIANIAIYNGESWITSSKFLLEGTMRAKLLKEEKIFEKDITVKMLKDSKKIALLNAMIGFDELKDYSFFV